MYPYIGAVEFCINKIDRHLSTVIHRRTCYALLNITGL